MNVHSFIERKRAEIKISMVTCYDFWSAKLIEQSSIDCILVGDSVAMVMHGFASTLSATVEMMVLHIQAVRRGAPNKFIVGDLPFMSYRKDLGQNMAAVESLMRAGANAVKLEGLAGNEDLIRRIVQSGVPVMGHLGLVPQSINSLGGYKVQGKGPGEEELILAEANTLASLGCFSLVLECLPAQLAERVTGEISIPTIGIGAGVGTDGQVLVLQDLLGLSSGDFKPKFLRKFVSGNSLILEGLAEFDRSVKAKDFPSADESYS